MINGVLHNSYVYLKEYKLVINLEKLFIHELNIKS